MSFPHPSTSPDKRGPKGSLSLGGSVGGLARRLVGLLGALFFWGALAWTGLARSDSWDTVPLLDVTILDEGMWFDVQNFPLPEGTPPDWHVLETLKEERCCTPKMDSFVKTPWAMMFRLKNRSTTPKPKTIHSSEISEDLIMVGHPRWSVEHIDLLCKEKSAPKAEAAYHWSMGKEVPLAKRPWHLVPAWAPIYREAFQELRCFLWITSSNALKARIRISTASEVLNENSWFVFAQWIYFGGIFTLVFYNMFIFLYLKDSTYLWYSITTLFLHGLFQMWMHSYDVLYMHLMPEAWLWTNGYVFMIFASATGMHFAKSFVRSPQLWFVRLTTTMSWVGGLLIVGCYFFPPNLNSRLAQFTGLICIGLSLVHAFILYWKHDNRLALLYMMAWTPPSLGGLAIALREALVLNSSFLVDNLLQMGSLWESLILALGLGYRYRLWRAEADQAARALQLKTLELEKQRSQSLRERIAIGASLSDALNSPVMALQNFGEQLSPRMKKLESAQKERNAEALHKASVGVLQLWDLMVPQMQTSLKTLKGVSHKLEELRESDDPSVEPTALLTQPAEGLTASQPPETPPTLPRTGP